MHVTVFRYYDFVGIWSTFGYLCWMNYIQSLWKLVSDQKTRQYQIILTAKDEILFHSTSTIFSSLITLVVCKWWLDRLRFRQFPNHSNEQINNFSIMSLFKWKSCFVVIAIAKMKSQHSLPVKKICQNFKMFLFSFLQFTVWIFRTLSRENQARLHWLNMWNKICFFRLKKLFVVFVSPQDFVLVLVVDAPPLNGLVAKDDGHAEK